MLLALIISTAACKPIQMPNISIGPIPIEVPPAAVVALATGAIPLDLIQDDVLSLIGDRTNGDIVFAQEYERGPSMTLISIGPALAAAADLKLKTALVNGLPPLERDMAFCGSNEVNNVRTAIPTAPNYPMPEIRIGATPTNAGTLLGSLRHVKGRVTQLRLVPDEIAPPSRFSTTFALNVAVRDIEIEVEDASMVPHFVRADSIMISCGGEITATNEACGDQVVRCATPAVTITGYTTDVPYLALLPNGRETIEALLTIGLSLGVKLHFQNFAASSLVFTPGDGFGKAIQLTGRSTLMPDGTSMCSPTPPIEPLPAPTRAFSKTTATWGRGEYVGTRGDVLPYELIPEADVELKASDTLTRQFMVVPPTQLEGANVFGLEAPSLGSFFNGFDAKQFPFRPYAMSTRLRVVERVGKCWVKPVPPPQFFELVEGSNHILRVVFLGEKNVAGKAAARDESVAGALPESLKKGHLQFADIREASFEKEIAPLMKERGLSCEKGCGDTWSRVQAFGIPAGDGPFDPRAPRLAPVELIVWLDRDAREIKEVFSPSLECGHAQPYQERDPRTPPRRFADPRVTFDQYKIDSIDLPSTRLTNTDTRGKYRRDLVSTLTGLATQITLTDQCLVTDLDSCWTEGLALPTAGSVSVTQGFSDTTVPSSPIRSSTPAAFGSRTVAVHGLFDRSGVAVFTNVPRVYRDIGLTTKHSDYRGTRYFDWAHTPMGTSFSAPGPEHIPFGKLDWRPVSRPYFADWKTDVVTVSHRATYPMSYCTLPQHMFAVPTGIRFEGGGLAIPVDLTPSQVFTSPPGPSGDYRLAPGLSGQASAASFVGP